MTPDMYNLYIYIYIYPSFSSGCLKPIKAVQKTAGQDHDLSLPLSTYTYIYIYIYICIYTIYRHVFRCSTAHQCSLVQSGYGMATIYIQAIVSDNRLWDDGCRAHIQRA